MSQDVNSFYFVRCFSPEVPSVLMEPARSPLDLRWRMFGIEVRIHPTYWLFALLMGWPLLFPPPQPGERSELRLWLLGTWVACHFASILIHELGHVIAGRIFGVRANIVLYSFGGLAIGNFPQAKRWQRIVVALAGPAAGLALWGTVVLLDRHVFWPNFTVTRTQPAFVAAVQFLIFMNFFWSLVNLIPVFPLDGGQVLTEVCGIVNPRKGMLWGLGLSFVIGGLLAGYSVMAHIRNQPGTPAEERLYWPMPAPTEGPGFYVPPLFGALLFGILALQSLQFYRQMDYERRRWEDR